VVKSLSPKSIQILVDIKKELLSKSVMITSATSNISTSGTPSTLSTPAKMPLKADVMITHKSTQVMRHARTRGWAVQRIYQRGEL